MKKILVLTPRFPYPVIGGDRLRIYKICEALSKKFDVTLLSLCESKAEIDMKIEDVVFKEIHRVYLSPIKSKMNVLCALHTKTPLQIAYYKSSLFEDKFNELIASHDAVYSHLIRTAEYSKNCEKISILEMTDAISLNYKRVRDVADSWNLRTLIYKLEQKKLETYERKIAKSFNLATFVSDVDRDFLYSSSCNTNVKTYKNGVDTKKYSFVKRNIDSQKEIVLIFIGNMNSLQNMDAVTWFAKKILPKLCSGVFNFKLKVIGRITDNDRSVLNSLPHVHATGTVDNINDACKDGHFGICSMRLGAGIQNKVLEYMALGLPCLTSSVGFEGIGAVNNRDLIIADTEDEYRVKIGNLINDIVLYQTVAFNARRFVEDNYSWESKLTPMVEDINNLLGE